MKKNALVFCGSANMTFAIASALMDFIKYNKNLVDDIIIFHNGIYEKDINLLKKISDCRCELYEPPFSSEINFNQGNIGYFTEMVLSKFECLRLLEKYNKILYLDYDIVIKSDLKELFHKTSTSGIRLQESGATIVRNQFTSDIDGYDMTLPSSGYGIFVLDNSLDLLKSHSSLYKWCINKTCSFLDKLYCPEQGIFELMFQEFNLHPERDINSELYCCHPSLPNVDQAKIVHAYGQPKFWNGRNNEQWNANYRQWIKMGGTPNMASKDNISILEKLKKFITRD